MAKVSDKDAKAVAKESVGKYPPSRPPRTIIKRGTGLSESEKKRVQKKAPVTIKKVAPKSPAEIARIQKEARLVKLSKVLRPILPRGTAAGGERRSPAEEAKYKADLRDQGKYKVRNLNTAKPRELSSDEARANAQRKARDIEAAKDAKMRDAARIRDEKAAKDKPGPNAKAENVNQAEADRRVAKGLKEIKAREATAAKAKAAQAKAKLKVRTPRLIKVRGGAGLRGTLGSVGGGGGMNWENK